MPLTQLPAAGDVMAYLGMAEDPEAESPLPPTFDPEAARVSAHIANVASAVRSYCRGRGFGVDGATCQQDVREVIVSATARSLNASPGIAREEIGSYSVVYDGRAYAFTLRELSLLNSYRRTAV